MARDELLLSDLSQSDAPASRRGFSDQVMDRGKMKAKS
jgi:hypothetical protein